MPIITVSTTTTTTTTATTTITTTTAIVIVSSRSSDNAVLYVHKLMSWLLVCNANVSSTCAMRDKCVIIKSIVFG